VYPVRWTVAIPSREIALDVATPLDNQELATATAGITYWEGLIDVRGTAGGRAVQGRGYLEMTGYKGSLGRVMSLPGSR
jgi:predicted secreted hydrolase